MLFAGSRDDVRSGFFPAYLHLYPLPQPSAPVSHSRPRQSGRPTCSLKRRSEADVVRTYPFARQDFMGQYHR